MIMTQLAMMDAGPVGNSIVARGLRAISHFFGFGQPATGQSTCFSSTVPLADHQRNFAEPTRRTVPAGEETISHTVSTFRWRRHTQLLNRPTSVLPDEERKARQHAVQGLYAARDGALEIAEHHFTSAAACPSVFLCEIPGFWQLSRSAMMTAVHGYDKAGRLRDASALNARIRTQYRPHAISPVPTNVTDLPTRRLGLAGTS